MSYGVLARDGFTGNIIGNVTGNLWGTVFGNVSGNVTGSLRGNVTGNLTGDVSGNLLANTTVQGSLTVLGNLLVSGNMTVINSNTLKVDDSLIALAINNNFSDILDIGFYGTYNAGTGNLYTGLARDASDSLKCWKFFKDLATEPTQTVNFAAATLDNVCMGNLYATNVFSNVVGNIIGGVLGNVTGNLYGTVLGDITSSGNSFFNGNVTAAGNLVITGNATEFHSFIGTTGNLEPSANDNYAFMPVLNLPMIKSGAILSIAAAASSHIGTGNMTLQPWVDIGTVSSPSITFATPAIVIGSGAGTDSVTGNVNTNTTFSATNRIGVRVQTSADWDYTTAQNTITVLVRYKLNP